MVTTVLARNYLPPLSVTFALNDLLNVLDTVYCLLSTFQCITLAFIAF